MIEQMIVTSSSDDLGDKMKTALQVQMTTSRLTCWPTEAGTGQAGKRACGGESSSSNFKVASFYGHPSLSLILQ